MYSFYNKKETIEKPIGNSIIGKYYTAYENSCAVVLSDNSGYKNINEYDFSHVGAFADGSSIVCKILTEPFVMHNYGKHLDNIPYYKNPLMVIVEDMKHHKTYAVMYDEEGIIPDEELMKYSEDGIHIKWWPSIEYLF